MIKNFLKYCFTKLGFQINKLPKPNGNPNELITAQIGKFNLLLNRNHSLPGYLKALPHYSKNLPRLATQIKQKYTDLILIDIGANVGDTVALTRSECDCKIVCIEGNEFYFDVLKKNLQQFKDVFAFNIFLADEEKNIAGNVEMAGGTLKIVSNKNSTEQNKIQLTTLDNFLTQNSNFKTAKLLKIDTDGFDMKVMRGGINYIAETKPILFFEYDRTLLEGENENGLHTLYMLEKLGYENALYYDNYGRFMLSAELKNHSLIEQLHYYIEEGKSAFRYYDMCLFHKDDTDIYNDFVKKEIAFFKQN